MPRLDNSLPLALDGYAWLPDRRRRAGGPLATRLAALDWTLPPQDLTISLRRIPARPRSGVVLAVPALDRTMVG